jgi:lipid II:glycine glycyltransferase (peptidoglycan interpeptide bridge formation enzyme)
VKLFAAYLEGIMIGGILIFIANRYVVHAQYIASDSRYQEYRPLNATIDSISIWAKNAGYKYFNLGMATEPGGIIVNDGLMRFKEGFGARGVLRETMNKIL